MTRYSVDWSAHGGHRVYNTRAEAQAHALRVKLGRGEDAIITEIQDGPPAKAAEHSTPAEAVSSAEHDARAALGRSTWPPPRGASARFDKVAREAVPAAQGPAGASSDDNPAADGLPPSAEGLGITPTVINAVLDLLERDEDLRIARHAAKIREYRGRNAAGVYRWPKFKRTPKTETAPDTTGF